MVGEADGGDCIHGGTLRVGNCQINDWYSQDGYNYTRDELFPMRPCWESEKQPITRQNSTD
jgi:hypothetical protein